MGFSPNFVWGAASSSYQVEGAALEGGKKESVWDLFCRKPGVVKNGHTGSIACDHYHHFQEDIAIMKEIGIQAYRFSISWPRVLPDGTGAVNPKGMDFYQSLVDQLLEAGITPYITLFHWDFPAELYYQGGWLNENSPDWFAAYADKMVRALGDRVSYWMTINEPACYIELGLQSGAHAPGDRLGFAQVLRAAHHTLLGHGKAVQAIRAAARIPIQVGLAQTADLAFPEQETDADIEAARAFMFTIRAKNFWKTTWWTDPIFLGRYPEDGLALYQEDLPAIKPQDMETIHQPLDFFGLNMYTGYHVRAQADGNPEVVTPPAGSPFTTMGWAVHPKAIHWGPRLLYERYHSPILITENGMANTEWVSQDGKVHDPQRSDFLQRYLLEYRRLSEAGVPTLGYFYWSILDNFEWAEGYTQRFGLVHVDYATQKRTVKDSAFTYRDIIASNGDILDPSRD
jgi:beta-glucosidase